jgi:hypothetical protein
MDPEKKKYFFFPKPHLNHFLFLLFFVISILKKYVNTFFPQKPKIPLEFLELYIYNLSDFFSIIPLFILQKRTKRKKEIIDSNSNKDVKGGHGYIYNNREKTNPKSKIRIFILTISDYIAQISSVIFYVILNEMNIPMKFAKLTSLLIINVIVIFIISKLILHNHFYRHHSLSLLINIICLIVLIIVDISNIINYSGEIKMQFIYIIIKIVQSILYSLEDVLIKVLILSYYLHPFKILFKKALFQFFYNIIFNFPFIFIKLRDKDEEKEFLFPMIGRLFEDKINILITFIYAGISFIYNGTIFKIIDEFSPNHFAIARVIENFGILMLNIILEGADSQKNLVFNLIIYILLIIAALVYNEFFIINICGLSKYTKYFLDFEAESEISMIGEIINNNEEKNGSHSERELSLSIIMYDDE